MRSCLPLLLATAIAAPGETLPNPPIGNNIGDHHYSSPPIFIGNAPLSGPVTESFLATRVQGTRLVLDWSSSTKTPARFRVLKPDGRAIAMRRGKRSVQGWIASLRIAGWPSGIYLAEAESDSIRIATKFLIP